MSRTHASASMDGTRFVSIPSSSLPMAAQHPEPGSGIQSTSIRSMRFPKVEAYASLESVEQVAL